MRCACVDIGSNTTRLLVAEAGEGQLREVLSQRAFTRLSRHEGAIPEAKLSEIARTVAAQVRAARDSGAETVRVVATAAVRHAANREDLCAAVRAASGLEVAVLTGDEEARFAFLGATGTLPSPPSGTVAVVDVGGGSTELVCGTVAGGVDWSVSLPIGSGALADAHLASDPPTKAELDAVRVHVRESLAGLAAPRAEAAYAVGGSATSLWRVLGPVLDRAALGRGIRALCAAPVAQTAARLGLEPLRARMLPAGMIVLDAVCELLGVPLQIGGGGLREGVILEQLGPTGGGPGSPTSARP